MDSADRDRKKAWKERQREAARSAFPLSDPVLQSLFNAVQAQVEECGCDHSHRFTRQWLSENHQPADTIIAWLENNGGFCDCEVCANVHDHWLQNR